VVWTLTNAIRSSADIYRAPWDITWPPVVSNIADAWNRAQLGVALANSAYVTALTVGVVLAFPSARPTRSPDCGSAAGAVVYPHPRAADHPDRRPNRSGVLDLQGDGLTTVSRLALFDVVRDLSFATALKIENTGTIGRRSG